jgi:hypothetical protein
LLRIHLHKPYPDSGRQARARGGPAVVRGHFASKSGQQRRFHGNPNANYCRLRRETKKSNRNNGLLQDYDKLSGSSDTFAANKFHKYLFLLIF